MNELITWYSGDGEIKKQIDYILISDKHKNWVKNVKTKGIANINQNYQHQMIQTDMVIKLKNKNNTKLGNKHIEYDIIGLRNNASELKIDDDISENISELIKIEEKANRKTINEWGKYEHRKFNNILWHKTKTKLNNVQNEKFPKSGINNEINNNPEKTIEEINNGKKLINKRDHIRNNISVEIGKLTEKFDKIKQSNCFNALKNNVIVSKRFIIIEYFDKMEPNINNDWVNIFDRKTKINYNWDDYVIMSKKEKHNDKTKRYTQKNQYAWK